MQHVVSEDGTKIAFDRRGRGRSGDTQPYSVEREIEDVAALIADTGQQTCVYGHSAGSALALRAAAAGLNIAKLALADPPYGRHGDADEAAKARQAETAAKIQAVHDRGDHRGAAAFFLGGFGLPSDAINEMLDSPAGQRMIDCARALPYDYAMVGDGLVPTELAAKLHHPRRLGRRDCARNRKNTRRDHAERQASADESLNARPSTRRYRTSSNAVLQLEGWRPHELA